MRKITTAFGIGPLKTYLENSIKFHKKTILRCKERPLEDIENSKIFAPAGQAWWGH